MLNAVFFQVLAMSAAGSILWLVLRALRPVTGRCCSAAWQAGTRLFVLAAYLLPLGLMAEAVWTALCQFVPGMPETASAQSPFEAPAPAGLGAILAPTADGSAVLLWDAASCLWLAGTAVVCILALVRQARFQRRLSRTRLPVEDAGALTLLEGRRVRLFTSSFVDTPLGAGLFRPALYLPEVSMSGEELALVLRHELAHLSRRDLLVKWAALLAVALHWFNPLVWAFSRELSVLCEAACDEAAVSGLDRAGRRRYGETLLNVLARTAPAQGVCSRLSGGKAGLKLRLSRLLRPTERRRGQALCTILAAALFFACIPCAAAVQGLAPMPGTAWTLENCRAWTAKSYRKYESLGLTYDPAADTFAYRGERVALLLDERQMASDEREIYPWATCSFDLYFVDRESENGPCLATIRDVHGELASLRALTPAEAADYLNPAAGPVTFNSFSMQRGVLIARDPAFEKLPADVRAWAENCGPEIVAVRLDGENATLCYPDLHCPWKVRLGEDGVLELCLFSLEGSDTDTPTVIQIAADRPVSSVRAWLDDVPLDVVLEGREE